MTVLRPRIDWRSLDRAALGEAYNSAAAVANSGTITASWEPRGAAVRQRTDAILDLAYGPRPRNRIDFIKCDRRARRRSFSCTVAIGRCGRKKASLSPQLARWQLE